MESKEAPPPPYNELLFPLYNAQQPPPPGPSTQTVFINQITIPLVFGPQPMLLTCPFCHQTAITTIKIEPNSKTHLFAVLLCVLGCWPCFWIPYVTDGCQSKRHFCRNCVAYLGVYSD